MWFDLQSKSPFYKPTSKTSRKEVQMSHHASAKMHLRSGKKKRHRKKTGNGRKEEWEQRRGKGRSTLRDFYASALVPWYNGA